MRWCYLEYIAWYCPNWTQLLACYAAAVILCGTIVLLQNYCCACRSEFLFKNNKFLFCVCCVTILTILCNIFIVYHGWLQLDGAFVAAQDYLLKHGMQMSAGAFLSDASWLDANYFLTLHLFLITALFSCVRYSVAYLYIPKKMHNIFHWVGFFLFFSCIVAITIFIDEAFSCYSLLDLAVQARNYHDIWKLIKLLWFSATCQLFFSKTFFLKIIFFSQSATYCIYVLKRNTQLKRFCTYVKKIINNFKQS